MKTLTADQQATLLAVAREAIQDGFAGREPTPMDRVDPILAAPGACFVTLERQGRLRGCIGSLHAVRPLVDDVAHNAWASAFRDHRFAPLQPAEWDDLQINLSVLSPPEPLAVTSRADLLAALRPGVDGLVLSDGNRRATFLPAVWASLPDPEAFVDELLLKAGLPAGHWSASLRAERYTTSSFGAPAAA